MFWLAVVYILGAITMLFILTFPMSHYILFLKKHNMWDEFLKEYPSHDTRKKNNAQ